jgi:hypothetical protein
MLELLDFGGTPEIYSDGIADVTIIGEVARLRLYIWRQIDGEFKRVLSVTLLRPVSSLGAGWELKKNALTFTPQFGKSEILAH